MYENDDENISQYFLRQIISFILINDSENLLYLLNSTGQNDEISPFSSSSTHFYHSKVLNSFAQCGETPGHIVIYKNSPLLLSILLSFGLHPHAKNRQGDSLLHLAMRIGSLEILSLLYETGECNLSLYNEEKKTPLDIFLEPITEEFYYSYHQFKEWNELNIKKEDFYKNILVNRQKCLKFLTEKLKIDEIKMNNEIFSTIISYNREKNKITSILQGTSTTSTSDFSSNSSFLTTFIPSIYFESSIGNELYTDSAKELFLRNIEAVEKVSRLIFADEYVNNILSCSLKKTIPR